MGLWAMSSLLGEQQFGSNLNLIRVEGMPGTFSPTSYNLDDVLGRNILSATQPLPNCFRVSCECSCESRWLLHLSYLGGSGYGTPPITSPAARPETSVCSTIC